MALKLIKPWADTPVTGGTPVSLPLGSVNFGADWVVQSTNNKEAWITNQTTPYDAPERFRFGRSEIANVFTNSGIDPNFMTTSKRGTSIVCQLNSVLNIVDTERADFKQQLPLSCHLVIKVPNNELLTADEILGYVERTLCGLFETDSNGSSRLNGFIRGALLPPDVK